MIKFNLFWDIGANGFHPGWHDVVPDGLSDDTVRDQAVESERKTKRLVKKIKPYLKTNTCKIKTRVFLTSIE